MEKGTCVPFSVQKSEEAQLQPLPGQRSPQTVPMATSSFTHPGSAVITKVRLTTISGRWICGPIEVLFCSERIPNVSSEVNDDQAWVQQIMADETLSAIVSNGSSSSAQMGC